MTEDFLFALACLFFLIAAIIHGMAKAWGMFWVSVGLLAAAIAWALPIVIK